MKIRNGFVSNSSSSSFIIRKSALNEFEDMLIRMFFAASDSYDCLTEIDNEDIEFIEGSISYNSIPYWSEKKSIDIFKEILKRLDRNDFCFDLDYGFYNGTERWKKDPEEYWNSKKK